MPYFNQILDRCDTLFIEGHWLSEQQLSICGDINPNFMYLAVRGFCNEKMLPGRPYGDFAVWVRKSLNATFK
jgi:hypothetical protein